MPHEPYVHPSQADPSVPATPDQYVWATSVGLTLPPGLSRREAWIRTRKHIDSTCIVCHQPKAGLWGVTCGSPQCEALWQEAQDEMAAEAACS